MIRLALPNTTYTVPETGLPVEGRMKVFLHDSDEYATLYTLEGANYVQAENPQILHAGLPDSTLFTALGVFDVVIEKYIGTEGMLSVDSPDSDFEQVGDYEVGMDFDIGSYSRNTVDTLEDLRGVNPELGMVTVKWYAEEGDCVPRTYVWDAECENTEDGGYVVGSDLSDTGKWILMYDGDTIPATFYGVTPGNIANITLLLNFPRLVGSFQMTTASRVYFPAGTYPNTEFTVYPTKGLVFDGCAKFPRGRFRSCPSVEVIGAQDSFIGLEITFAAGSKTEAHSSWYSALQQFWRCGAATLVIDKINYFTSSTIVSTVTVTGATIKGSTLINTTFNATYLRFDNCKIEGQGIFDESYRLKFENMREFRESWFQDQSPSKFNFGPVPGTQGGAIEFFPTVNPTNIVGNVLDIADFTNPDIYLKALSAWMGTVALAPKKVDLEGRTVSSVPLCVATEYSNMTVLGDMYLPTTGTVTLRNVTVLGEVHGGGNCVCYNCTLNWRELPTTLNAYDSTVGAAVQVTGDFPLVCENCSVLFNINNATDNETQLSPIVMRGCRLTEANGFLKTKNLRMEGCICEGQTIEVYPYKNAAQEYENALFLSGCEFISSVPVKVTKKHTINGTEDTNCHHVKLNLTITGNNFAGNNLGIVIDFWGVRNTFKYYFAASGNSVIYEGNSGKCPLEKPCGEWFGLGSIQAAVYPDNFGTVETLYVCEQAFLVMPDFSDIALSRIATAQCAPSKYSYNILSVWARNLCLDAIISRLNDGEYGNVANFGYFASNNVTGDLRVV